MIALVRVDNRLLHGQILEAWLPRLGAREVVVADDDAAASPLARAAMTLALPAGLPATHHEGHFTAGCRRRKVLNCSAERAAVDFFVQLGQFTRHCCRAVSQDRF